MLANASSTPLRCSECSAVLPSGAPLGHLIASPACFASPGSPNARLLAAALKGGLRHGPPCPHCAVRQESDEELAKHQAVCEARAKPTCPVCAQEFSTALQLTTHRRFPGRLCLPKTLACPDKSCPRSYASKVQLEGHLRAAHPSLAPKAASSVFRRPSCTSCGAAFPNRTAFIQHRCAPPSQLCPKCNGRLASAEALAAHLQESACLRCAGCQRDFRSPGRLAAHLCSKRPGAKRVDYCPRCHKPLRDLAAHLKRGCVQHLCPCGLLTSGTRQTSEHRMECGQAAAEEELPPGPLALPASTAADLAALFKAVAAERRCAHCAKLCQDDRELQGHQCDKE